MVSGCQDTVSIAADNRCSSQIEVLEESIRLISDVDDVDHHTLPAGGTVKVVVDDPEWTMEEFRVREAGSDNVGRLLVVSRSDATDADGELDFVFRIEEDDCP